MFKIERNKCPKCDGNLLYCTQPAFTLKQVINKDGSIKKLTKNQILGAFQRNEETSLPTFVKCGDCHEEFDFDQDANDRIVISHTG